MKRWALIGLGLAACSPPSIDLSLAEDEHLVWASLGDDGQVTAAGIYHGGGPPIAAPLEASLIVWVIPSDGLVDKSGRPFEGSEREGIVLRSVDTPRGEPGSCGRCLVATDNYPLTLLAGDSCPIPAEAPATLYRLVLGHIEPNAAEPGTLAQVRSRLRLETPGACACSSSRKWALDDLDFEVVTEPGFPALAAGLTSDQQGGLYGFLPGRLARFGANVPLETWPDPLASMSAARRAITLDNGDLWVDRMDPILNPLNGFVLYRYRRQASGWSATRVEVPGRIQSNLIAAFDRDPEKRTFIAGSISGLYTPAIVTCDSEGADCSEDRFTELVAEQQIGDLDVRSDGAAYASSNRALFYKVAPLGSWETLSIVGTPVASASTAVTIDGLTRIAVGEQRLVAAFWARGGGTGIASIPYDATGAPVLALAELGYYQPRPDLELKRLFRESAPERFIVLEGQNGDDDYTSTLSIIDLDALGKETRRRPAAPTIGPELVDIGALTDGKYAARDRGDSLYLGDLQSAFTKIHGIDDPYPGDVASILELDTNTALIVSSRARMTITDGTGSWLVTDPRHLLSPDWDIRSAALDVDRRLLLATAVGLFEVELEGREIASVSAVPGAPRNLQAALPSADGPLRVIDDNGAIFRIDNGRADPIDLLTRHGELSDFWRLSAAGYGGVWWLAGTDGTITRCVGDHCTTLHEQDESYVDLTIDCPDDVLITVGGTAGNRGALHYSSANDAGALQLERTLVSVPGTLRSSVFDGPDLAFITSPTFFRGASPTSAIPLWGTPRRSLKLDDFLVIGGFGSTVIVARRR